MTYTEVPTKKRCPKCKQIDVTTFSKCKHCGTRYDAAPPDQTRPINLGLPIVLAFILVCIGYYVFQYAGIITMSRLTSHPDRLIGKTLPCLSSFAFVSMDEQNMRSLDAELLEAQKNDPKRYGSKGLGGIMSAASALESLASGKETSGSVIGRYYENGRIALVENEDFHTPLSVSVIGASNNDKFPLVHVKMLNSTRPGSVWWLNVDQLDLNGVK